MFFACPHWIHDKTVVQNMGLETIQIDKFWTNTTIADAMRTSPELIQGFSTLMNEVNQNFLETRIHFQAGAVDVLPRGSEEEQLVS